MLKDTLLNIIGNYSGDVTASTGLASLDIPWIFASILFITLVIMTSWFACRLIVGVLHE